MGLRNVYVSLSFHSWVCVMGPSLSIPVLGCTSVLQLRSREEVAPLLSSACFGMAEAACRVELPEKKRHETCVKSANFLWLPYEPLLVSPPPPSATMTVSAKIVVAGRSRWLCPSSCRGHTLRYPHHQCRMIPLDPWTCLRREQKLRGSFCNTLLASSISRQAVRQRCVSHVNGYRRLHTNRREQTVNGQGLPCLNALYSCVRSNWYECEAELTLG